MFKRSFGGDQIKAFLSDFSRLETVGHTNVQTLNHNLNSIGDEFLADLGSYYLNPLNLFQMGFVLIATCIMTAPPGKHTICTTSQDGSQLYLDGKLLVDNGGLHGRKKVSVHV